MKPTIAFFGSTAAVDGWRVCIVDTVDELNPNAANALLKVLEEPPRRSLFLLVSHAPARVLPTIQSAGRAGDDSLLRQLANVITAQGYVIEGAHEANPDLLIGSGLQAGPDLSPAAMEDAQKALGIAAAIGKLDVGQAVVVAGGVVLAVEAQEGTQAMLRRIPLLPATLRGTTGARKGVLAKLAKPIQDVRLDMPTIGVATVDDAAEAGLCGIVARSHHLLIVDKPAVFARAAEKGVFIYGHDDN